MLSVNYCKRHFSNKKNSYSDKEIEEIRDSLYQLAELLISKYILNKNNKLLPNEKVKKIKDMKTKEKSSELRV